MPAFIRVERLWGSFLFNVERCFEGYMAELLAA